MTLINQYIMFHLDNASVELNTNQESNTSVVRMPTYHTISKAFSLDLKRWAQIDFTEKYSFQSTNDGEAVSVEFVVNTTKGATYFDVSVTASKREVCVSELERLDGILKRKTIIRNKYTVIQTFDSVSEYYCELIYPKLAHFERLLKQLLYDVYIFNFGQTYYLQIKNMSSKKEKGQKLQRLIDNLTFAQYKELLFEPRYLPQIEEKTKNFLAHNQDLTLVDDTRLRELFLDTMPRSDWERFFSKKIQHPALAHDIKMIQNWRNNIAHNKNFSKTDYEKCDQMLDILIGNVSEAIQLTMEKDFTDRNIENLSKCLKRVAEAVSELRESISASWLGE